MGTILISIIGIALMILLTVGAAYLVGPQFLALQANSQAMFLSQFSSQILNAATLRKALVGQGVYGKTSVGQLMYEGYLEKVPINPFLGRGGMPFRLLNSYDPGRSDLLADIIFVDIGISSEAAEVCRSINRQSAGFDGFLDMPLSSGSMISTMMSDNVGCFRMHLVGIAGEANPQDYVVYFRM